MALVPGCRQLGCDWMREKMPEVCDLMLRCLLKGQTHTMWTQMVLKGKHESQRKWFWEKSAQGKPWQLQQQTLIPSLVWKASHLKCLTPLDSCHHTHHVEGRGSPGQSPVRWGLLAAPGGHRDWWGQITFPLELGDTVFPRVRSWRGPSVCLLGILRDS